MFFLIELIKCLVEGLIQCIMCRDGCEGVGGIGKYGG